MDKLEQRTFKIMANPIKIRPVLRIKYLGVSSEHLNFKKHSVVSMLHQFYVYYHVRRVPKRFQILLPYEAGFNPLDNPYSSEGLFKLCKDYDVSHNPMSYQNEQFFETHHGG